MSATTLTRSDRLEILESLASRTCGGCGALKKPKQSHCSKCYYRLPPQMRRDLYKSFGQGYEEAYVKSLLFLDTQP